MNPPAPDVLCLGETMILLTPGTATSLEIAAGVEIHTGGAESNLAMNLAATGLHVGWTSRVGDDPFGRRIVTAVAERGVDTRLVEVDPTRPTAVYFKDPGASGSTVYYYRRGSAAAGLTPAFLDRLPLAELRLLHLSGITPGLSTGCRETVAAALTRMRSLPGLVCFDVNYRAGVWGIDEAAPVLTELARQADVVLVGRDEAETLWGPECSTAEQIRAHLPDVAHLVVKDGAVGATEFWTDELGATGEVFVATPAVQVVEPVGAGDAFGAGYLSGLLEGLDSGQRLLRGHRLAALALSSTADVADAAAIAAATQPHLTQHPRARGPMTTTDQIFGSSPVMAILRGLGPERTVELAQRAWDLGLVCVEVPVQSDRDADALLATAEAGAARGMTVGAGTIITPEQVERVAALGAAFTVSPGFDPEVVRASLAAGLPALPGVATATDVQLAVRFGLTWLKAFPASVLTPAWFAAMRGPFPQVRFCATGGIDATNAQTFLDAGARLVAVGSALTDEDQLPALAALAGTTGVAG